jgi:hypothetical protein
MTDIVVITVSFQNDELDLTHLTSADASIQEANTLLLNDYIESWEPNPWVRWETINLMLNFQPQPSIRKPAELCDKILVRVVAHGEMYRQNWLYVAESFEVIPSLTTRPRYSTWVELMEGEYICALAGSSSFFLKLILCPSFHSPSLGD